MVQDEGIDALAASAPARWFTPPFRRTAAAEALVRDHRSVDPADHAACCNVLATADIRAELPRITAPPP